MHLDVLHVYVHLHVDAEDRTVHLDVAFQVHAYRLVRQLAQENNQLHLE